MADDKRSSSSDPLTHFNAHGDAHMVGIAQKPDSIRHAVAKAKLIMAPSTFERILAGQVGKGDVLGVARIAGISGAKRCADLIPLCHPVRLTAVDIQFKTDVDSHQIEIEARVEAVDRTGPDMEAMAAASAAALTVYDMCKAMDRSMQIVSIALHEKSGGKSGTWARDAIKAQ